MKIKEAAMKYDRSIVAVAVALGCIFAAYIKIGGIVDSMIERSPVIQSIKISGVRQEKDSDTLMNEVKDMKQDIRSILRELRRR